MMQKIVSELHGPHVLLLEPVKQKTQRGPYKEYRCDTGQIPSKSQIKKIIFTTLECQNDEIICTLIYEGFGVFIVV